MRMLKAAHVADAQRYCYNHAIGKYATETKTLGAQSDHHQSWESMAPMWKHGSRSLGPARELYSSCSALSKVPTPKPTRTREPLRYATRHTRAGMMLASSTPPPCLRAFSDCDTRRGHIPSPLGTSAAEDTLSKKGLGPDENGHVSCFVCVPAACSWSSSICNRSTWRCLT
jgi:hypothetical protein